MYIPDPGKEGLAEGLAVGGRSAEISLYDAEWRINFLIPGQCKPIVLCVSVYVTG